MRARRRPPDPLSSPPVEQRPQEILAETDRYRVRGSLSMARDGYRSRLSDYLNAPERSFLALTDVELTPLEGGNPERYEFLALSVNHIVFAVEAGSER
jgi:hypothetical protein